MVNHRVFRKGDDVTFNGKSCEIISVDNYAELKDKNEKYPVNFFISTTDPDLKFDLPENEDNDEVETN